MLAKVQTTIIFADVAVSGTFYSSAQTLQGVATNMNFFFKLPKPEENNCARLCGEI